jgi:hypothetical protein
MPDASQDSESDIACLLRVGQQPHTGIWATAVVERAHPTQNRSLCCHEARRRTEARIIFFSVQRLHGFRQVVTHVQSQQKDEL